MNEHIAKKVALLKTYAEDGVAECTFWPNSIEQFRVWEDPAQQIFKIGSKATIYLRTNKSQITDAKRYIETLIRQKKRKRKPVGEEKICTLKQKLATAVAEIAGLANSLSTLRSEFKETKTSLLSANKTITNKEEIIADLRKEIKKILPIRKAPDA
jgi:chromosome segregation ATPase